MQWKQALKIIKSNKGKKVRVTYHRQLSLLKRQDKWPEGTVILKKVVMVLTAGQAYEELAGVLLARATGEMPAEPQPLNGQEWVEYPILKKSTKSGKVYVAFANETPPVSTAAFTVNGKRVKPQMLDGVVSAKDWKKSKRTDRPGYALNIPLKEIQSIVPVEE